MILDHVYMPIMAIGILIISAYLCGLLAKKLKIGEVIGQIVGGILIGPNLMGVLYEWLNKYESLKDFIVFKPVHYFFKSAYPEYEEIFHNYHFFIFIFLGMIAFSIGEELHIDRIKKVGYSPAIIAVIQAVLTMSFISLSFWLIFDFTLINALIVGSIGIATAPAMTFILLAKFNVKGTFKNVIANIIVIADIIEVVLFSIFIGIAVFIKSGKKVSFVDLSVEVIADLFFACLIGFIIFLILKIVISRKKVEDDDAYEKGTFLAVILTNKPTTSVEIFLLLLGLISVSIAVALNFHLPFLISVVFAGFLISNFHYNTIFDSLRIGNVMSIFNLFFFAIIGASVRFDTFSKETIMLVVAYIALRTFGKLFGNWLGCRITGQSENITKNLPKLMLPQAGMAAVETIFVSVVLKGAGGEIIFNTIIPALVFFEIFGAWFAERTLKGVKYE